MKVHHKGNNLHYFLDEKCTWGETKTAPVSQLNEKYNLRHLRNTTVHLKYYEETCPKAWQTFKMPGYQYFRSDRAEETEEYLPVLKRTFLHM